MALTIAIDGPVGAGKSSIAKGLAKALDIAYLDTGATYRALGLKAIREGIDPRDEPAAGALAERTEVSVRHVDGEQSTFLDGENVTDKIRTPEVSAAASAISTVRAVRERMVALQRDYAKKTDMVLDGRDIGTRVLPDATFKFFLNATPEERARRRHAEMLAKGEQADYESVLRDLTARDRQDMGRAVDPLRCADGAREIDTTGMTEREVLDALIQVVGEGKR